MFFVEKKNKNSQNSVLQLVESKRIRGESRQRIVISLGSDFPIPKEMHKEVARVITAKLQGQQYLFASRKCEEFAEHIVRKIQLKGDIPDLEKRNETEEIEEVYINQINHKSDRIAGPLVIGKAIWDRIGMAEILDACGFNQKQIKIATISILNRLISQNSENAIPSWTKVYAAADLIYSKAEETGKDPYYLISDHLLSKKSKIEEMLYEKVKTFFNLDSSIILYDLTNTYFEGLCKKNPKAEYNRNQKEKRYDCPQIVIALLLDGDGFVIKHKIFNGKMSDAKSLRRILLSIKKDYPNPDDIPTIIFDRGVTSAENIELINKSGLKYIIASRSNKEKEYLNDYVDPDKEFITVREDKNNKVDVYLREEENENYLLCKSSGRKEKEQAMRNKWEEFLIEGLEKVKARIFSQKTSVSEIEQSLGRLQEKYTSVAQFYEIKYTPYAFNYELPQDFKINKRISKMLQNRKEKVEKNEIGYRKLNSDIKKFSEKYKDDFSHIKIELTAPELIWPTIDEKLEDKINLEGNYLLRTNRKDLNEETFWNVYIMLMRIEHAFRHLKSDLGLRPNYHQKEKRVDAHVNISIISYQILQSIEHTLRQKNCTLSWNSVKRIMTSHTYSTITIPTTKGDIIHLRKPGEPESVHKMIYEKLNIDHENLPAKKTRIKCS